MAYSVDHEVPISAPGGIFLKNGHGLQRPTDPICGYADMDGFFGSAMQHKYERLRGRPIGIVPHSGEAHHTTIIAVSREAKARGVRNVISVREAKQICPEIELVPQEPDYIRRLFAHLMAEIETAVFIDAIKSIDEIAFRLDAHQVRDPEGVMRDIQRRISTLLPGGAITISLGASSNRLLAKLACKQGKPRGTTVWHPRDLPGPLLNHSLMDVPGIADGLHRRLLKAGIWDMETLLRTPPKLVRKITGSLVGERIILSLLGYELPQPATARGAFGHAKVLAPDQRRPEAARSVAKALLVKAGRKMRRQGFSAGLLELAVMQRSIGTKAAVSLPAIMDETSLMEAFSQVWSSAMKQSTDYASFLQISINLTRLSRTDCRQLDWIYGDEALRRRRENVSTAVDGLNQRFGKTVVSHGLFDARDNLGAKISFSNVPSALEFI